MVGEAAFRSAWHRHLARWSHLGYPLGVALVLAAGAWVLWPVLRAGLITDDFIVAAMIDGRFAAPRAPLDLFVFTTGEPGDISALQRLGSMPYWVADGFRLAFMRPLASATVHLDRWLFGGNVSAYHAHSLMWWALLSVSVAALFRRCFAPGIALSALAIFALNDAHHFPVLWLANRGGLMALTLGVLALRVGLFGQRDRRTGVQSLLVCVLFSLSLSAGEWGFALLGYALAHALVLDTRRPRARALALWPFLLPAAVFLAARAWLGYGAQASGVYVDPLGEPLRFITAVLIRIPLLTADVVFDVPAHYWDVGSPWRDRLLELEVFPPEVWRSLPGWRVVHVAIGYAAVLLTVVLVRFGIRTAPPGRRPTLVFFALGACLSLLPVAASFPSSRLALPAWLGGSACIAQLLATLATRLLSKAHRQRARIADSLSYLLVLVGAGYSLLFHPLRAPILGSAVHFESAARWARLAEVDDSRLPEQHVFIVNGVDFSSSFFFPYVRAYHGLNMPRTSYPLTFCRHPLDLLRDGPNSFLVRPVGGTFLETDGEVFFRGTDNLPDRAERFVLPEMTVEVVHTREGRPLELRFMFARPLSDPSYVFLASKPRGMEQLELPEVGDWIRLPRATTPTWYAAHRGAFARRFGPFPDFLSYDWSPDFLEYRPQGSRQGEAPAEKPGPSS